MSWMFHITGCVVQVAAAKAAEKAKDTQEAHEKAQKDEQEALGKAQKDEQDEAQMDEEDDDDEDDDDEDEDEEDEEPIAEVAKKRKKQTELVMSKKKKEEKEREEAALLEVAKRSENSSNSRTKSSRRSITDPPSSKNVNTKKHKPASDPEPVVTKQPAAKQKTTAKNSKKLVGSKKRKQAEDSSPEPVVTGLKQRTPQQVNPRKDLTVMNKNTDVMIKKGTKLQIRHGRNKGTLYNATVTKVLNDEFVMVRTEDKDPAIAKIEFKIVRLTEDLGAGEIRQAIRFHQRLRQRWFRCRGCI